MLPKQMYASAFVFIVALPGIVLAPEVCWDDKFECGGSCGPGETASYCEDNPVFVGPDGAFIPSSWRWETMNCFSFSESIDISCDAPVPPFWEPILGCVVGDGDCCIGKSASRTESDGDEKFVPGVKRPCGLVPGGPGGSL